jgi:hypothetical protein
MIGNRFVPLFYQIGLKSIAIMEYGNVIKVALSDPEIAVSGHGNIFRMAKIPDPVIPFLKITAHILCRICRAVVTNYQFKVSEGLI